MRHVVAEELKNDMINYRMFTGCILIIVVALLSRIDMFQKLIEFGNSPEGPGWYSAYRYCVYAYNTLLVIPIAVTFAAGESAEMELRSRFCLFSYIRSGKRKYLIAKAMGLIVSGGMMVVFSMFVLLVFSIIGFAKIPALDPENINLAEILQWVACTFPVGFLNGAFWSVTGGTAAVFTKSRYMAYTVPFILYYVLTVFQERYFRKWFFLSPRYWADTSVYGNIPCMLILLILTIAVSCFFLWTMKRRLDYA